MSARAAPDAGKGLETIRIFATVANAGRLNHLEHKLHQHAPGLFVSNR